MWDRAESRAGVDVTSSETAPRVRAVLDMFAARVGRLALARGSPGRPMAAAAWRLGPTCGRRLLCSAAPLPRDPYNTLGLPANAPTSEVKAAYYRLAMQTHPDRSEAADAPTRFAEVGAAYAQIMGTSSPRMDADPSSEFTPRASPFAAAFPAWAYRWFEYLQRVPQRLDMWLAPSYSSIIYQAVRAGDLGEALSLLDEMKEAGETPSHAVYEMLIRGCAIAMRRPPIGGKPDHLTLNMVQKVLELWGDMQEQGRNPDYLTHIELLRAFGKAGQLKQAHLIFEQMCGKVQLLPEERAFNSMYEACVMNGAYADALHVFDEQEEMRKSLWKPRFTPVSFSLLLTATAATGSVDDGLFRLQYLPRVLARMHSYRVLPRDKTCDTLLAACVAYGELETAKQVLQVAERAGHELDPKGVEAYERRVASVEGARATPPIEGPE